MYVRVYLCVEKLPLHVSGLREITCEIYFTAPEFTNIISGCLVIVVEVEKDCGPSVGVEAVDAANRDTIRNITDVKKLSVSNKKYYPFFFFRVRLWSILMMTSKNSPSVTVS